MRKTDRKKAIFLTSLILFLWPGTVLSFIDVKERGLNTNGETKGVVLKDYYVYLADGSGGLKIVNVSNPSIFVTTGVLPMPGSIIEQVAVDNDTIILTDTKKKEVHFVDAWDTMSPELKWSLKTQGDVPRAVATVDGMAFVVEYGNDQTASNYFSGIEVFSYDENKAESIQVIKLRGIRDVVAGKNFFFVGGGKRLYIFQKLPADKLTVKPFSKLNFPKGEDISSLDIHGNLSKNVKHLFAFGKKQLYAVDVSNPLKPAILDQRPVSGEIEYRRVTAACIKELLPCAYTFLLLTTLKSYGLIYFDTQSGKLYPFDMYDIDKSAYVSLRDVYKASKGKVKIYDSVFSEYLYPGVLKGGTFAFGAIGDYGLGFVQMSQSP